MYHHLVLTLLSLNGVLHCFLTHPLGIVSLPHQCMVYLLKHPGDMLDQILKYKEMHDNFSIKRTHIALTLKEDQSKNIVKGKEHLNYVSLRFLAENLYLAAF